MALQIASEQGIPMPRVEVNLGNVWGRFKDGILNVADRVIPGHQVLAMQAREAAGSVVDAAAHQIDIRRQVYPTLAKKSWQLVRHQEWNFTRDETQVMMMMARMAPMYAVIAGEAIQVVAEGADHLIDSVVTHVHQWQALHHPGGNGHELHFSPLFQENSCPAGTYDVQPGDTLGGIAETQNVNLCELAAENGFTLDANNAGLRQPITLSVDDCLTIPGQQVQPTVEPTAHVPQTAVPATHVPEATPFPGAELFCETGAVNLDCQIPYEVFDYGSREYNIFQSLNPVSSNTEVLYDYHNFVNRFHELILAASQRGATVASADDIYIAGLTGKSLADVHDTVVDCMLSTRTMQDGAVKTAAINACANITLDGYVDNDGQVLNGVSLQQVYQHFVGIAYSFMRTQRYIRDTTIDGTLYGGENGKGFPWLGVGIGAGLVGGLLYGLRQLNQRIHEDRQKKRREEDEHGRTVVIKNPPQAVLGKEYEGDITNQPRQVWQRPVPTEPSSTPAPIINPDRPDRRQLTVLPPLLSDELAGSEPDFPMSEQPTVMYTPERGSACAVHKYLKDPNAIDWTVLSRLDEQTLEMTGLTRSDVEAYQAWLDEQEGDEQSYEDEAIKIAHDGRRKRKGNFPE